MSTRNRRVSASPRLRAAEQQSRSTHSHKSAKMTAETLTQKMKSQPRALPPIATDPFHPFREVSKVSPFEGHSPYAMGSAISAKESLRHLNHMQPEERELYDKLLIPSPPKGKPTKKSRTTANGEEPPQEKEEEPEATEQQEDEQRKEDTEETAEEKASPAPEEESEEAELVPNELTLTYLKVLQKSEDYSRRTIQDSESKSAAYIHKNWVQFTNLVHGFLDILRNLDRQEGQKRKDVEAEEANVREKFAKQRDASYTAAKRHEDIKPTCPLISRHKRVYVDPNYNSGLLAEFRWRGEIEAIVYILLFDDSDKLISVASPTELIKGTNQAVAVRKFTEQGSGLSIGGSIVSFQVVLSNMTFRTKRLMFCAVNRSPNSTLEGMNRGWFTLRVPTDGDPLSHKTTSTREVYACQVRDGGAFGGIAMASITRKDLGGETWSFGCENDVFLWANTAHRMATSISNLLQNGVAGVEMEASVSYERLASQMIFGFWEDLFRQLIQLEYEQEMARFRNDLGALVAKDSYRKRRGSGRLGKSTLDRSVL